MAMAAAKNTVELGKDDDDDDDVWDDGGDDGDVLLVLESMAATETASTRGEYS